MDSTDDSVDVSVEVSKEILWTCPWTCPWKPMEASIEASVKAFMVTSVETPRKLSRKAWLTTYLPGRWMPMDAFVGMFVDPSTETSADFYGKFIGRVRGISTEVHGGPSSSVEVHGNARGRPWKRPWKISQKPNSADVCVERRWRSLTRI